MQADDLGVLEDDPAVAWTIAFGSPVVPDEYSTHSGWSNGTGSNVSGSAGSARRSSHDSMSGPGAPSGSSYGRRTVRSSDGSSARIASTTSRRSKRLPPYV